MKLGRRFREEAMDQPDLDPELLEGDLRNLEALNRLFGGRSVVRRRLAPVMAALRPGEGLSVLDIGSGAGDLCRVLMEECRRAGQPVRLVSLDVHPQTQACARSRLAAYREVSFLRADAIHLPLRDRSFDLVLCTLALHHFDTAHACAVLAQMRRVARRWAIVSDLSRSLEGYAAVWFATRFMLNPMTRHDGPVSVQRAYTAPELHEMAQAAGWDGARLHHEGWFRMSLVYESPTP